MLDCLLDLLFPRRSLTGDDGEWVTTSELRSLRSAPVILDERTLRSEGIVFLDRIVAAAQYKKSSLLHRAIHTLKYKRVRGVGEALGRILVEVSVLSFPSPGAVPVLCPVPLHWVRLFSRGFNQSEVLARVVGEARGWEVKNLLRRTRWTGSQVGRRRRERLVGVKGAFRIGSGFPSLRFGAFGGDGLGVEKIPQHVILIDDLSTTGATLEECAKALKHVGVKNVEGLVIALG